MWDKCGMARNAEGLETSDPGDPPIREDFWKNVRVPGKADAFNQELEKAGRVADFLELGELMCMDALDRNESCGGHFREEYAETDGPQKGEAKRDDENYAYVAAWEWLGEAGKAELHKEPLTFDEVKLTQRSYK
jgi:succinate dehydrogenase / fumarate reductase flavoprotein subunit